ncbi:MAG TPA: hypothetical protein VGK19_13610 [Capsulimonadaceae bacterium]
MPNLTELLESKRRLIVGSAIALAIIGAYFAFALSFVPFVRADKLIDLRDSHTRFEVVMPQGSPVALLIAGPSLTSDASRFAGQCVVTSGGDTVASFDFTRDNMSRTNWLSGEYLQSVILDDHNAPNLRRALNGGHTYMVDLTFVGASPPNSSIWVHCVQRILTKNSRAKVMQR